MAACAWLASKPWHTTHKAPPAANCMESNQLVTHMSSCEGMNGWGIQTWTLTWVISCQGAGPSMNKWFDSFPVRVLSFHHEGESLRASMKKKFHVYKPKNGQTNNQQTQKLGTKSTNEKQKQACPYPLLFCVWFLLKIYFHKRVEYFLLLGVLRQCNSRLKLDVLLLPSACVLALQKSHCDHRWFLATQKIDKQVCQ